MDYKFAIQASNPRFSGCYDATDASLADAMQTVFPLQAEFALLIWNWTYVPLSYKSDLSIMVEDVINLLEAMTREQDGNRTIHWPSNTFAATWSITWNANTTILDAEWRSVLGDAEAALAAKPRVVLPTIDFAAEWKRPLEVIMTALTQAGYQSAALDGMRRVGNLVNKIQQYGLLYRD